MVRKRPAKGYIGVRLPIPTLKRLKGHAGKLGISPAELSRVAIQYYLDVQSKNKGGV